MLISGYTHINFYFFLFFTTDNGREDSVRCAELDREHILLTRTLAHDISVMDHIRISNSSTVHSVVEIFDTVATFLAGRSIQTELVPKDNYHISNSLLVRVPFLLEFGKVCCTSNISAFEKRYAGWEGLGRSEYCSRSPSGLEGAEQS